MDSSAVKTAIPVAHFNPTSTHLRERLLVHELFDDQVKRTPWARAVEHGGRALTYAQLDDRADQLARDLRQAGVGPDQPVALCFNRGIEMVVSLLAVLKAGGAYLPLDPNYPAERLQYMLEDAAPRLVLTEERLRSRLPPTGIRVWVPDDASEGLSGGRSENLGCAEVDLTSQSLVYVIYTSGSTGRPKGTAMTHGAMVNLIEWHRATFGDGAGRRVLQFAALGFDVAFQEIFSTLCTGGTLVLLDEWLRRDARALSEFLNEQAIQRLFVPPMLLQSLAECITRNGVLPGALQDVITAGEPLRISREICSLFQQLEGCRLHNHYGPTETHVVTALTLSGDPRSWAALPTIGRPIANAWIYILDEQRRPVPVGAVGELYIGGYGVARGYWGRPELTSQRFIDDPFATEAGARLYRTGDLGRWLSDGTIEFLGRNDTQVKIRGYRIELGEIETCLLGHEHVKEAVVTAREEVAGDKRLVAYVIPLRHAAVDVEALRAYLAGLLPDHMVPSAFVAVERWPLTANGKLDRPALPAPGLAAYVSRPYEAPVGEVEETLARVWQELLGVLRVGRQDSFMELGGNSLLVMRCVARIGSVWSMEVSPGVLFEFPKLHQFSARVEHLREARVLGDIAAGGREIEEVFDEVASLSEHEVQRLVRELEMGASHG